MFDNQPKPEKAIAVGFSKKGYNRTLADEHLRELISLAETAGAEVTETFYQELDAFNSSTAIGKGKVKEIAQYIEDYDIQLVIFDEDLSPVQVKNLELEFKVKVIDRSGLILDIFARRAQTLEAKTQVELAQLKYMLPRLTRMWTHLSKQYGGIGTKGPGETQIETDRRMIKIRIQKLQEKLEEIETQKEIQRKGRENFPRFSLVGYTNAGKSTLMNLITDSGVYVEDKLFATLDTTVRSFDLPDGRKSLISDTVGFIRKLPTHLVASFRSTLTEAKEADVLLYVIDSTHEYYKDHIIIIQETLKSLGIEDKPVIYVFNKIDSLDDRYKLKIIEEDYPGAVFISAVRGINLSGLMSSMQESLDRLSNTQHLFIPYSDASKLSKLYDLTSIIEKEDREEGYILKVRVNEANSDLFKNLYQSFFVRS